MSSASSSPSTCMVSTWLARSPSPPASAAFNIRPLLTPKSALVESPLPWKASLRAQLREHPHHLGGIRLRPRLLLRLQPAFLRPELDDLDQPRPHHVPIHFCVRPR